jgi:hypothetical protein
MSSANVTKAPLSRLRERVRVRAARLLAANRFGHRLAHNDDVADERRVSFIRPSPQPSPACGRGGMRDHCVGFFRFVVNAMSSVTFFA